MSSLRAILAEHRTETDKDTAHSYGEPYEVLLDPLRHVALAVLEIGVAGGGSLRVWRDYFTRAHILGIEIDKTRAYGDDDRVATLVGDATDPAVLELVRGVGPFELIIDDGSHDPDDQRATLEGLWPALRPGGLYVIEDIQASRHVPYLGSLAPGSSPTVYRGDRSYDDCLLIIRKLL